MASMGNYIYSKKENAIFTHLYTDSEVVVDIDNNSVKLIQETDYPWDGKINITINPQNEGEFTLGFRIPGWSNAKKIKVNNENIA